MFHDILIHAGLSQDEATVYEALLLYGPQGAGALLPRVHIKRGLLYKVLQRLAQKGLITEETAKKRTIFTPQPPDVLLKIIEDQESEIRKSRENLLHSLPEMKAKYIISTERPIIQFFEGVDGLRKIYEDKLVSGTKEHYFIRPLHANVYEYAFGRWFSYFLEKRARLGITTYALTPDDIDANHDPKIDAQRKVIRTWLRPEDYTTPIEIACYRDKIAIISYGKEIFGIVIEHEHLSKAIKDIFNLAQKGAQTFFTEHNHT
jgi:sugar-specific transcriptional regulator TrmB